MDTIIAGAGLSGLLLTHKMHLAGHKVTLLEARDYLGGTLRRPRLDFFPATSANLEICEWLKGVSPVPVQFEVAEHRPEMFDEGKFQAFAGFLDKEFQTIDQLSHLSHTHEIKITPDPDQIVRALIEQLPVVAQPQSEITEIKVTDGCVSEVVINGDKTVKTGQLFFTGSPVLMGKLINGAGLPDKHRTRLAKIVHWTSVVLELNHETPLEGPAGITVFSHSSKEFEPVFGRIYGNTSRWGTLVHGERADEHEFTGQCIRHIKRQLKRAWPQAFESKPDEKIYVYPGAFGQNSLKTKSPWLLPEIPNLFLVNHTLATQPGFMGSVECVKGVQALLDGTDLPAFDQVNA